MMIHATALPCLTAECGVPFELYIFPVDVITWALADENQPYSSANDPHVACWVVL